MTKNKIKRNKIKRKRKRKIKINRKKNLINKSILMIKS